jgi:hypothetical protein
MQTRLKAQLLKAVIEQLAGDTCILEERESSIKIILTESQKTFFKIFLDRQLDMRTKPDVEIDALGIILPVVLKRVWPFLIAGGGGLAALIFGRGKKGNEY